MEGEHADLTLVVGTESLDEYFAGPDGFRDRWTLRTHVPRYPRAPGESRDVRGPPARQVGPTIDDGLLPGGAEPLPDALARRAHRIIHLTVAYTGRSDIQFAAALSHLREVRIIEGSIRDLRPFLSSHELASLALQRNQGNLEILRSWPHLHRVFLEFWRKGAESLGELLELEDLHVGGWPMDDLRTLSNLPSLHRLSIGFGKMLSLHGIPKGIRELRLTNCPRLVDISAVGDLPELQRLSVHGSRSSRDLTGLERVRNLSLLSMGPCGPLQSLEPIRGLEGLSYVWLGEGAVDGHTESVDALYGKRRLETLFISRKTGLRPEIVHETSPGCDVRLVR